MTGEMCGKRLAVDGRMNGYGGKNARITASRNNEKTRERESTMGKIA